MHRPRFNTYLLPGFLLSIAPCPFSYCTSLPCVKGIGAPVHIVFLSYPSTLFIRQVANIVHSAQQLTHLED